MSFVTVAPDSVSAAATDLESLGSTINQANSVAARSTTALLPAAEDEVSAAIASLFGEHGTAFQALSAQAAAFHDEFVHAMRTGVGAYLSTELSNAEQTLLGAANAPLGSLGNPVAALSTALTPAQGILGPYETLFANTFANLEDLGAEILANPFPFLEQFVINQIGYAQRIFTDATAFFANPGAAIQAGIQGLQNFPTGFIGAVAHAQNSIVTDLSNAANSFTTGLEAFPGKLESGNVLGAISGLFFGPLDVNISGDPLTPPGLTISPVLTGTLPDLQALFTVPGQFAHDIANNALPPGSIPANFLNNVGNVLDTLTNTSVSLNALIGLSTSGISASIAPILGLPGQLAITALGAPINGGIALVNTGTTLLGDLGTGNFGGALTTLVDAPAVITNAFLNGQTVIPLSLPLPDLSLNLGNQTLFGTQLLGTVTVANGSADLNIPIDGLLVPETPITSIIDGTASGTGVASNLAATLINSQLPLNVNVGGTPVSGFAKALLVFAPQELAEAIGAPPIDAIAPVAIPPLVLPPAA